MDIFDSDLEKVQEDNIRTDYGEPADELRLGQSLLKHQDYPILVRPHPTMAGFFVLVDGHLRRRAALRVGITKLKAMQVEAGLTQAEIRLIQLRTDMKRKINDWERFSTLKEISASVRSQKELAAAADLDVSLVSKLMLEGVPEVERAFEEGLPLAKRYAIALATKEQQQANWQRWVRMTRAQIDKERNEPKSENDDPNLPSLKMAMPHGRGIVIRGGVNLESARDLLEAGLKQVNKAISDGLTAKSASAYWKDSSKKPKPPRKKRAV